MIDIRVIREQFEDYKATCIRRNCPVNLDTVLELDKQSRALSQEVDALRAERNRLSKECQTNPEARNEVKILKVTLTTKENTLNELQSKLQQMLNFLPNQLASDVPDGLDDTNNIINNNNSSEYIEAIVINSFLYDKFYELKDEYITRTKSQNTNLRTASLKALAQFGEVEFEQIFKIALNDRNWLIRKTAVDGLGILNTRSAINSLANAISDEEWWVRKLAAEAIVLNDTSLLFVEKILKGNDKYAADAIKNALYKKVHINGENII